MKTAESGIISPVFRRYSGGYTFAETLISLFIITAISGLLLFMFLSAGRLLTKSESRLEDGRGAMAARYYIGRELNDVRPSWKSADLPLTTEKGKVTFAWYKGVGGSRFIIENRENDLYLIAEEKGSTRIIKRIAGQNVVDVRPIEDRGAPYCLEFFMTGSDGELWTFLLPLAVIPLGEAK